MPDRDKAGRFLPGHSQAGPGRPSVYSDDLGETLITCMADGMSLTGAAGKIGVSAQTVYEWAKDNPAFSEALNVARAASAAWWEDRAVDLAKGGEGNASVVIFGLKNRVADEWRDKQEHAHTSPDGTMTPKPALDLSKLSTAALAELAALSDEPDT